MQESRKILPLMSDNQIFWDSVLQHPNSAQKPLVLIVEAHEPSRDLLQTILTRKGCDVIEADLENVMTIAEAVRPHLVMFDIGRPFTDGLETLKQMQTCQFLDGVPIIITSGNGTTSFREQVAATGYSELLVKPIDFDKLDWLLEQHLFTHLGRPSH